MQIRAVPYSLKHFVSEAKEEERIVGFEPTTSSAEGTFGGGVAFARRFYRLAANRIMKLDRAKRQMKELGNAVRSFFRTKPYKFSGKPNPQAPEVIYRMDFVKPIPSEIPLIAGEIIQNLRSALDHLAYQLYCSGTKGGTLNKEIAFPIAESKPKYDDIKPRRTKGMSPAAIAAIDAVQPYGGGNDVLWHLHALNNIDKHRLILTVGSAINSFDAGAVMQQKAPKGSGLSRANLSLFLGVKDNLYPLEVGSEIFKDQTSLEVIKIPMRFEIVLYEKGIIEGKSLVPVLQDMITAVEKVIADLKQFAI